MWQPIPELEAPDYSTVTLLFISSLRILYSESSDDPIFPADKAVKVPGDSQTWFRNSDPRARPLACLNQIEICTPDERLCLPFRKPDIDTNWEWTPEFTLLYTSLYLTDIYDSIKKRQGRALKAQEAVSGYFSTSLGKEAWANEVENLVAIAHARTQINAWSVASGEDSIHKNERYVFIDGTEKTCGMFKYKPQGYASLRAVPLFCIIAITPFLWLFSLEMKVGKIATQENVNPTNEHETIPGSVTTGTVQESGAVTTSQSTSAANLQQDDSNPTVGAGNIPSSPSPAAASAFEPEVADIADARRLDTVTSNTGQTAVPADTPAINTYGTTPETSTTARRGGQTSIAGSVPTGERASNVERLEEIEAEWKPLVCEFIVWDGWVLLFQKIRERLAASNDQGRHTGVSQS